MRKISRRAALLVPAVVAAPYVLHARAAVDERHIAAMLMLGFHGETSDAQGAQALARQVDAGSVGGVCFLGHNTKTRAGIEGLTSLFQAAGRHTAPLIAVDQEGGAVQRLGKRSGYAAFPSAKEVAAKNKPSGAVSLYADMAKQLKTAGFNLNLAPVVDLGFQPKNPVVSRWGRAYADDGHTVSQYAGAFVAAHRSEGMLTALKHFPGHGSTLRDSHDSPVDLTPTWRQDELTPFRELNDQKLIDVVMSGHLSHAQLTNGLPATLSPTLVQVLRTEVGFAGVMMTDDLDMRAIRSTYSLTEAIVLSIAAGYDLILLSNSLEPDPHLPKKAIAAVKAAVEDGRISATNLEASAERIAALSS